MTKEGGPPRHEGRAKNLPSGARRSRREVARRRAGAAAGRGPRRALLIRLSALLSLGLLVVASSFVVLRYAEAARVVEERLAAGYLTSRAGLYAAPRVLRAGQKLSRERLAETLRRAGYVEDRASNVWSGAFRADGDGVGIRPSRASVLLGNYAPNVIRVSFNSDGRVREITDDVGVTVPEFALEPEALTNDASMKTGRRAALAFQDIPPVLVNAILAIEDRRFFAHRGVDPAGVLRALLSWVGLARGENAAGRQGGSTITQQLVKNTYLTPERTLRRKFDEALLAAALERRLTKPDIFALYCNEVYLGQRGAAGVRGVRQAARVYFDKELKDLPLAEAATLAGMIQSPARYAPDRRPEQSRARRDLVLAAMLGEGMITPEEARAAASEPIRVAPPAQGHGAAAPYFVDYVNRLVEARLQANAAADERSLRVYTTIDLELQQLAEAAIGRQLARLAKLYPRRPAPQAALVALDAQTGHVLAMVGGRDYAESQLNRATDARRQPGSAYKPFVYAAALEGGISPAALFADAPRAFAYDRTATYRPTNYGGAYSMRHVTMRTALAHSLNVVTVDLALRTGLERVAALAERFGLQRPEPYPSLALGTAEAAPLEIAAAYTAFANDGARLSPSAVARAVDADGTRLFDEHAPAAVQAISPSTAYMLTDMLGAVVAEGTARAARGLLRRSAVAGKTGTSRDGWFVGYTPRVVCAVWVGYDDNEPLGLSGAETALPVWQEFVGGAVELRPELGGEAFARPDGVSAVEIDADTGLLASPSCPRRERVAVTPALAPAAACMTHLQRFDLPAPSTPDESLTPSAQSDEQVTASARTLAHTPRAAYHTSTHGLNATPSSTQVEVGRDGRTRLANALEVMGDR